MENLGFRINCALSFCLFSGLALLLSDRKHVLKSLTINLKRFSLECGRLMVDQA